MTINSLRLTSDRYIEMSRRVGWYGDVHQTSISQLFRDENRCRNRIIDRANDSIRYPLYSEEF